MCEEKKEEGVYIYVGTGKGAAEMRKRRCPVLMLVTEMISTTTIYCYDYTDRVFSCSPFQSFLVFLPLPLLCSKKTKSDLMLIELDID